ncbi:MAG: hypothetical protein NTV44_01910 [Firmicutes bacterium]|nr:hypothetical protein [Bacillota bacterium]
MPRAFVADSSANDDATLNSPGMDSFLLIVAITVLGLTSVIGYYIITRGKGPH